MNKRTVIALMCLSLFLGACGSPAVVQAITGTKLERVTGWTMLNDGRHSNDVTVVDVNDEVRCYMYDTVKGGGLSCVPLWQLTPEGERIAEDR